MKRSFRISDIIRFKKLKSECRRTVLKPKREYWETYCSSLKKHSIISRVWSVVRSLVGFSSFKPLPTLVSNSETVHSDKAKANLLSETFAAVSKTDNYTDIFLQHRALVEKRYLQSLPLQNEMVDFNRPFTMTELTTAIQSRYNTPHRPWYGLLYNVEKLVQSSSQRCFSIYSILHGLRAHYQTHGNMLSSYRF